MVMHMHMLGRFTDKAIVGRTDYTSDVLQYAREIFCSQGVCSFGTRLIIPIRKIPGPCVEAWGVLRGGG